MAKRFGFFNSINGDRKYLATDLSQAFDVGITTGLKADNADNFKIVPNENMQVKMMPGGAMIFGHYLLDEEEEIINLDMADAELNRIDRIVLRYDKFERSIKTVVIKGTPALTPVAPTILRTNEQFDLVLADIYIAKAVTSITEPNITDMRESELCGFIGVKGAVSQIVFDAHVAELSGRHIKESGSNANGRYIKFDDGTMICSISKIIASYIATLYLQKVWTYPASFIDSNIATFAVSADVADGFLKHRRAVINVLSDSNIALSIRAFAGYGDTFTSGDSTHINAVAIGRWK